MRNVTAPHQVTVLVLEGAQAMDTGIPAQIFRERSRAPYRTVMAGPEAGEVRAAGGFRFAVDHGLEALESAQTIVVPGYEDPRAVIPPEVCEALRAARDRGTRIASVCTGAFALAAAGLLDGLRATTHWAETGYLAERYPRIRVDRDVLFVDEGQILTSAGVAAGIDLCLHLIRRDHGVRVSNEVARYIVAAPYRGGGQAQYIPRTLPETTGAAFARTREWALTRLHEDLTVRDLAGHAHVSYRTFSRRFSEDTGCTPLQWLLRARIDVARELLESTDLGIDDIAARAGLGTGTNLRLHFQRLLGTTPSQYRKSFARPAGLSAACYRVLRFPGAEDIQTLESRGAACTLTEAEREPGGRDGGDAGGDAQPAVDVLQVLVHRPGAAAQVPPDRGVGQAVRDQAEHLLLPCGQRRELRPGRGQGVLRRQARYPAGQQRLEPGQDIDGGLGEIAPGPAQGDADVRASRTCRGEGSGEDVVRAQRPRDIAVDAAVEIAARALQVRPAHRTAVTAGTGVTDQRGGRGMPLDGLDGLRGDQRLRVADVPRRPYPAELDPHGRLRPREPRQHGQQQFRKLGQTGRCVRRLDHVQGRAHRTGSRHDPPKWPYGIPRIDHTPVFAVCWSQNEKGEPS